MGVASIECSPSVVVTHTQSSLRGRVRSSTRMSAFADKFPEWKDFPSGLHVLVVDEDEKTLQDVKLKLEACDYVVTAFSNGNDALGALHDRNSSFHVALVEATASDALDGFKIVEAARHLPTIMMSNTENLDIMMQGIAAGASEFLQKPLSSEKLKNIWQHVVRKALCTGELVLPNSRFSTDAFQQFCVESAIRSHSVIHSQLVSVKEEPLELIKSEPSSTDIQEADLYLQEELVDLKPDLEYDCILNSTRFPGPSTPQLEQASRLIAHEGGSPSSNDFAYSKFDRDNFDECNNYCKVKVEVDDGLDSANLNELLDADCKGDHSIRRRDFEFDLDLQDLGDMMLSNDLVEGDALSGIDMDSSILDELPSDEAVEFSLDCLDDGDTQGAEEEALLLAEVARVEVDMASGNESRGIKPMTNGDGCAEIEESLGKSDFQNNCRNSRSSKRKMKVDWTPDLHRRFVQAVEQLGVDKAIPSRILELMGVQCLTRHNIASHLQKYRSHRRHLLAREVEAATWNQRRQVEAPTNAWVVSRPPQPARSVSLPLAATKGPPLHVWGHPTLNTGPMHFWSEPSAKWHGPDGGTFWHQSPPACVDAWGHPVYPQPVLRLPLAPMPGVANLAAPLQPIVPNCINLDRKISGFHPPKETVDAAINEVLRNPLVPLPLGLKPPSLESVLAELQRQGIKTDRPAPSY